MADGVVCVVRKTLAHTLWNTMVTLCTTCFNIHCARAVHLWFLWS